MRKTVKLADVLWEAANVRLTAIYSLNHMQKDPFSCNAVALALSDGRVGNLHPFTPVHAFIEQMGCSGSAEQLAHLCGHGNGSKALQGVRYMWLLLAMHVAEDEGIEIEVEA